MLAAVKEITEAATVVTKWTAVPVAISAAWSRTPTGKAFRWVWKRLVTEPADQRFGRRVGLTVAPLIDDVKAKVAAAREKPLAEHGENQHTERERGVDNINSSKGGTGTSYTLRRLARDAPEMLDRIEAGELSVNHPNQRH